MRTILKGIHPKIDEQLEVCSHAIETVQKIQSGDIITLTAEELPEDTEEKKKRKKALLFFINSLKNLKSEIKRIDTEFTHSGQSGNTTQNQLTAWGRIIGFAKGPFGIVTLVALAIVGYLFLQTTAKQNTSIMPRRFPSPSLFSYRLSRIQIILYKGKQIPLNQVYIGHGSDCNSPHYHALTGSVTTLDGIVIPDPEGCGYGKVKDVHVSETMVPLSPSQ